MQCEGGMTIDKTADELAIDEIRRKALEAAATELERLAGSPAYMQAWKRAIKLIRAMKP